MTLAAALAAAAPGRDHGAARLLGEGLWGRVLDLGDGTVVKLLRQGGGLGDAVELWANERRALEALEGVALPFAVPRLVAAGTLDPATTGCLAFLRTTRIAGHALDDDRLAALAQEPSGRFACQLGEALAALHAIGPRAGFDDPRADEDRGYLAEIAPAVADVAGPEAIAAIEGSLTEIEQGGTVACHGDVNSTNILVDDDGRLVGLVDWAEARRDWREAELCHIAMMPELLLPVRRAYEAASGVALDDGRLDLAGLHNALIGLAICRRTGEAEEAAWNLGEARRLMTRLGLDQTRP